MLFVARDLSTLLRSPVWAFGLSCLSCLSCVALLLVLLVTCVLLFSSFCFLSSLLPAALFPYFSEAFLGSCFFVPISCLLSCCYYSFPYLFNMCCSVPFLSVSFFCCGLYVCLPLCFSSLNEFYAVDLFLLLSLIRLLYFI